jgi:hypothetical protein
MNSMLENKTNSNTVVMEATRLDFFMIESILEDVPPMAKGRKLIQFRDQITGVDHQWKQVRSSGKTQHAAHGVASLAAWQYYAPIARSLVALGGKASTRRILATDGIAAPSR